MVSPANSDVRLCPLAQTLQKGAGEAATELARFVQIALGSASELECELLLARDLNYLDTAIHERLSSELEQIKRMMSTLLKRVRDAS